MGMTSEEQDRLIDELLKGCKGPQDILGKHGLLKRMNARFMERALAGEMTAHLGYEPHEKAEEPRANTRNGSSAKTVLTDSGAVEIGVPRDRLGSFEPTLIPKGQRRLSDFDEKVIALYARGLTTREIQAHLEEIYGVEVSPALVSAVTSEVTQEVRAWQSRPLQPLYPIIYFDALFVSSRQEGPASQRAVYLALGLDREGNKELLGLWIAATEGAKFWLGILTELQARGLKDCFVACVDGLSGFAEALQAVYPRTHVQLCLVHKVRSSLRLVPWKNRKAVAADLRPIYAAATLPQARAALEAFEQRWGAQYPLIARSWRRDWSALTTYFDYPVDIRKALYTTNAIESLNYSLRRVLKNRGAFPDDASITKVLYLAIIRVAKKWTRPVHNWGDVVNQFMVMFGDRMIID